MERFEADTLMLNLSGIDQENVSTYQQYHDHPMFYWIFRNMDLAQHIFLHLQNLLLEVKNQRLKTSWRPLAITLSTMLPLKAPDNTTLQCVPQPVHHLPRLPLRLPDHVPRTQNLPYHAHTCASK